jgi:type I restriction enzyme R subunit
MTAKGRSVKIIAFIRQAAIGDALIPHETRVNAAIQRVLARNNWTDVQRKWLNCIGEQMVREAVVDRAAIDEEPFS